MVVYFIRHGETDFNKRCLIQGMSDIPLNDKGIHQAELAADWFKQQGIVFDGVFSSPLVRARKQRQLYQAELLRKCIRMQEFRRWTLAWMKESLTR